MKETVEVKTRIKNYNRPAYIVFVIAAVYFLLMKDYSNAAVFAGIALMFDPFDIEQPFKQRPLYQKLWLLAHLSTILTAFILMLI